MSIFDSDIIRECEAVIASDIRPKLIDHNGDICIESYCEGTVYIRLLGQCSHCPSSKYTVESLVEKELAGKVKHVERVCLTEKIGDELLDFARKLLQRGS